MGHDLGERFALFEDPAVTQPLRVALVISVLVHIFMVRISVEFDLITGVCVPDPAFAVHVHVVDVVPDINREFIALCLSMQIFVCDLHGRLATIPHAVVPPVVIFSVLIAMEVDDDLAAFSLPGFVAHDLHIRDEISLVMAFRIFAVLDVDIVGSAHRAIPARQHFAVPFPVILLLIHVLVPNGIFGRRSHGGFLDDCGFVLNCFSRLFRSSGFSLLLCRISHVFFRCLFPCFCRLFLLRSFGVSGFIILFLHFIAGRFDPFPRFVFNAAGSFAVRFLSRRFSCHRFSIVCRNNIRSCLSCFLLLLFPGRFARCILRRPFLRESLLRLSASGPGDIRGEDSPHIGECKHACQ